MHQIPCLPEDVFNALRDSHDGLSTCNHCTVNFSNMTALKAHINKHVCPHFDRLQAMMTPIVARPDVCMHLRHRSITGLMLDKGLCSELATRCAFCHVQVHAKAMLRHYRDSHPDLLRHAQMHQDFIHGLANFGSGRGECPMCRIKTQNVQKHQCCVVYQLAAMTGHIFQPEHFPTMPCMMRPWYRTAQPGDDHLPDEAPTPAPAPKKPRLSEASPINCARETTSPTDVPPDHGPSQHKCDQCQACFLSAQGLQHHVATQHPSSNTATADPQVIPNRGRPPGKDTIQNRFAQPSTTEIPIPIQDFTCPLCQETIGRKAISTHLRTVY